MKKECLRTEVEAVKYCVKSEDIKELYLVKSFPLPGEALLKKIKTMRSEIAKRVREINFYFGALREVKQKLVELSQNQEDEMKISLKGTHQVAMIELSAGIIDYVRWSQDNAIRSFEALQPGRMDQWMEEVSSKIFSFLEHLLKHIDSKQLQNFSKMKQFKKIPTDMALRSLKSAVLSSSSDFNLIHPTQFSSQYSGSFGQRESSIFSRDFSFLNHKQLGQKDALTSSEQTLEPPSSVKDAFKHFLILKSNDKIALEKKKSPIIGLDKFSIPHLNRENKQISSNSDEKQREIQLYETRQKNLDKLNYLSERKLEKTKKQAEILPLHSQGSLNEENHNVLRNNPNRYKFSSLSNLNQPQISEEIQDISNDNQNNSNQQKNQSEQFIMRESLSPPVLKHISSFNYHNQGKQNYGKRGTLEGFETYQENLSESSNSLYQLEEEEEDENVNSNTDRVKYSMADLQRIDLELKEKKDQFKNTHRQLLKEAELQYKKQRNKTEPCGEAEQKSIQKPSMTYQSQNNTQTKESLGCSRVMRTEGSQTTKDGQVSFRQQRASWQEKRTPSQQEARLLKGKEDTLVRKAFFEEQFLVEGNSTNVNSFQKSVGLLNEIASTSRKNKIEQSNSKPKSSVAASFQIHSPPLRQQHLPLKKTSISLEQLATVVNPKNLTSVFSLGMLSMKGDNHGRVIGNNTKDQPIILGGIQADSLRINSLALNHYKSKQNAEISLSQQQQNGSLSQFVEKSANQSNNEEQKKQKAFHLINQLKHHTQSLQGDIKSLIQSCSKF